MKFELPKEIKKAIPISHFPTIHQAFIYRAWEYVSYKKIAEILETTEENVKKAACDMGLPEQCVGNEWLRNGYITIIKQMWHILPYEQLVQLLETDRETLAITLREEDFLDLKLDEKPICEKVVWRELTEEEIVRTAEIKKIMETISFEGVKPFDFKYDVPNLVFSGKEYFSTRYIYLFSGLYLRAFEVDSREYCSDELLESYQKLGINGIWTQGVLYQLTQFPFAPEMSTGYEKRIANLKNLVERCKKYGIKLYLYINEPRMMPDEFYKKYPHLEGHEGSLCTSTKEVQNYLKDNIEWLCRQVPDIGGFFMITRSENRTNCYSHSSPENCNCDRCSKRSVGEVIGEVISCVEEGAHRVSPDIKVIAWDWSWGEEAEEIIEYLPKNVTLMCKSEEAVPFEYGGIKSKVVDYTISKVGPGEKAKSLWNIARKKGLTLGAKIQLNTSWECSTVPAVPTYPIIEGLMRSLKEEGVSDLMLSWTLGGYPSLCLAHAAKYFYENCDMPEQSDNEKRACEFICEALNEFPPDARLQYHGPQNSGPSAPLYDVPTGYSSTMTCFPYDNVEYWCEEYPQEVVIPQLEKVCDLISKALELLGKEATTETEIMALATYYTYKSALNQFQFIRARDCKDYATMVQKAQGEVETARGMLSLMNKNAAIAFEAANQYYYSKGQLAEKIINCQYIIEKYSKKN